MIKNINGIESEVKMDVAPFIKDGRTMLPLRFIAEALGFKVEWNHAARTVILTDKEFKVEILKDIINKYKLCVFKYIIPNKLIIEDIASFARYISSGNNTA